MTRRHAFTDIGLSAVSFAMLCSAATAQTSMPGTAEPSATERTAIEAAFTRADTNGDGKLSREEAARMPAIAARFDELVKNHDGVLSREEFAAGATAPVQ